MAVDADLARLADRWRAAPPSERAHAHTYIIELCEALGVERPRPKGTGYEFEHPVRVVHRDGSESVNRVDLFKQGHFLLEAKDEGEVAEGSVELRLRRAFGQASSYAAFVPGGPPPYLMVLDVGRTLRLWDRWSGSYGGFQGAARTIDLTRLAENAGDAAFLRLVWEDPASLDPNVASAAVTKEIAGKLARLAARLEQGGEDQERVARFLIRCVFTMFAEDIGLLQDQPFLRAVEMGVGDDPALFESGVAELWAAMDEGRRFGLRKLLRFNGHFFRDQDVVPLDRDDLAVLLEAARADWSRVEPSIFGTLLTRALDREERHRLGAEFTPRSYVERLVRPTIEEPVRERWTMVQAEVLQLREKARTAKGKSPRTAANNRAIRSLREFHDWLRSLRVLDPACGSGNFLYVAMSMLKEIELEVVRELEEFAGGQKEAQSLDQVGPWQFHGIEIKPWAREVAELCLWVGYHQWWRRTHGHAQPPEPVLRDTGTLECRDAVLAWDEIREVPEKARPDPTPRIEHPVTGELVPDPEARLPYYEYVGARQAEWPEADFIVGNPPYLGGRRMRAVLGDGYVDALRSAYPEVPDGADLVMHWWYKAAQAVRGPRTVRAGLITTNSIVQRLNRPVVAAALAGGVNVVWTIPDHPWVDEVGGAAVRVALTVLATESSGALYLEVDSNADITKELSVDKLNSDLTAAVDVQAAAGIPLLSNRGLSFRGMIRRGQGFLLEGEDAARLLELDESLKQIIRPLWNGRDLSQRYSGRYAIDFGVRTESEARKYPILFDILRKRVMPGRQGKREARARELWWQFWNPREELRAAIRELNCYIATAYVSKFRIFGRLPTETIPDDKLIVLAFSSPYPLGVLSSAIHVTWATAVGSKLEDRPTYNNPICFDPFPFPDPDDDLRDRIAEVAERLDSHRASALARDESVTMTGMYNVVEKLRNGEALTPKERKVHEVAACGVLRDLHDELDRLVAEAYGWPWPMEAEEILARLVALHDDRIEEERRGLIRWLRPEYQVPRFAVQVEGELVAGDAPVAYGETEPGELPEWPLDTLEQLTALRAVVAERPATVEQAARRFKGARRAEVAKHLEALEVLGVVTRGEAGRYQVQGAGAVATSG